MILNRLIAVSIALTLFGLFYLTNYSNGGESPPQFLGFNLSLNVTDSIVGQIWEDVNNNGIKDESPIVGIPNITVRMYDCVGVEVGTTTSDLNGEYVFDPLLFPALGNGPLPGQTSEKYRLEFELPGSLVGVFVPSQKGTDNGTGVQNVLPGDCADYGLIDPSTYCGVNPGIAVVCFPRNNDPTTEPTIVFIRNDDSRDFSPVSNLDNGANWATPSGANATNYPLTYLEASNLSETSTSFGLTWDTKNQRLFTGSYMRAYAPMKSNTSTNNYGEAIISQIPVDNYVAGIPSVWLDLELILSDGVAGDYLPDNNYPGPSVYGRTGSNPQLIGYTGLGSIKIAKDNSELYVVNLKSREVYVIPIGADGSAPTVTTDIKRFPIPDACSGSWPDGRPYSAVLGLGVHPVSGRVFVTSTCTGPNLTDMVGQVYSFDPADNTPSVLDFQLELTIPLNFKIPTTNPNITQWYQEIRHPWESVGANTVFYPNGSGTTGQHTQNWLGEVEFDIDDNGLYHMVVATRNRYHDLINGSFYVTEGVFLRTCNLGTNQVPVWNLENRGSCGNFSSSVNWTFSPGSRAGANTDTLNRFFRYVGREGSMGAGTLTILPKGKEIIVPATDNVFNVATSGVAWLSTVDGDRTRDVRILGNFQNSGYNATNFTKANNWGAIAAMCPELPLQIGNFAWIDTNGDGVQDPCESPLSGLNVTLYDSLMSFVSSTLTFGGEYYFSSPDLNPNAKYYIVFGEGQYNSTTELLFDSLALTIANSGQGPNNDWNDSDAETDLTGTIFNGLPYICYTTGDKGSNHHLDIGFKPVLTCELTIDDVQITCVNNIEFSVSIDISWDYDSAATDQIMVEVNGQTMSFTPPTSAGSTNLGPYMFAQPKSNLPIAVYFSDTTECRSETTFDLIACTPDCIQGQLGGKAFQDDNNNGIDDAEPGQPNVIVYIYECDNPIPVDTAYTNLNGNWSAPGLANYPYRIEFDYSCTDVQAESFSGVDNGTSVQLVNNTSCAVNLGLLSKNYCNIPLNPIGTPGADGKLLGPCIGAVTCGTIIGESAQDAFALFDFRNLTLDNTRTVNNSPSVAYHHPDWHISNIGNVFGLAIDNSKNVYVAASSNYGSSFGYAGNTSAVIGYGSLGGGMNDTSAAGTIYRMDATSGAMSVWAVLPQRESSVTHWNCELNVSNELPTRQTGVGLGNVVYDTTRNQFYVSNFEDGKIYLLDDLGNTISTFDPLEPDDNQAGWANNTGGLGGLNMVYGMAINYTTNKLFFGTFGVPNQEAGDGNERVAKLYSIDLDINGNFVGMEQFHWDMDMVSDDDTGRGGVLHLAISDLHFLPNGSLLVGGRSTCAYASSYNHFGTNYLLNDNGSGVYNITTQTIRPANSGSFRGEGNRDGYGGVSYCTSGDDVSYYVMSSSDLGNEEGPHGLLALDPNFSYNGSSVAVPGWILPYIPNSMSASGTDDNKGVGGDVELFNGCGPLPNQIGNYVWNDMDNDGVQDACELPIPNLMVVLYNKQGDTIAMTQTDAKGEYYFSDTSDMDQAWIVGTQVEKDSSYYLVFGKADSTSSSAIIVNGNSYSLTDANTGEGLFPDLNDSDFPMLSLGLPIPNGLPYICYTVGDSTDHSIDLGLVALAPDLALCMVIDTIGTNSASTFDTDLNNLSYGDTLKFQIKLFNQGDVPVDSIHITDYVPAGLQFINDTLAGGLNEGWSAVDPQNPVFFWGGAVLDTAASDTFCIYLTIEMPITLGDSVFTNYAEISFAADTNGTDVSLLDIDSDLDSNPNNNGGGLPMTDADDHVDGDAKGAMNTSPDGVDSTDQDNVDPAKVVVVDVALVEKIDPTYDPTGITYGDSVKILIEVINQGNVIGDSIKITNFIPSGFSFDPGIAGNTGWMVMNDSIVMLWVEDVDPGERDSSCIYLTVEPNPEGEDPWTNETEITTFVDTSGMDLSDKDIDSELDDNPENNGGGDPNTPADDEEDGDGKGSMNSTPDGVDSTDQDNADPILFEVVDLALTLMIDTAGTNGSTVFDTDVNDLAYGDTIKFKVELINQGNVPIDSLNVTNYLPEGLVFVNDIGMGGLNEGWDATDPMNPVFHWGGDTLTREVRDTICIYMMLEMPMNPSDSAFTSIAEISFAQDTSGADVSRDDLDSDLDNDPDNNGGSLPMTNADNHVNGDAKGAMNTTPDGVDSTDQDNVDPAKVAVIDVALVEKLDPNFNPMGITYGDSVKILIEVINQGNVIADSIKITNFIPSGFVFDSMSAGNAGWVVMNDSILMKWIEDVDPGERDSTCLYLTVEPDPEGKDPWTNETEISTFIDSNGVDMSHKDIDSPLDDDPDNNGGGDPETPADDEENGDAKSIMNTTPDGVDSTDQDNADPLLFPVVDLALTLMIDTTGTEGSTVFDTDVSDLAYGDTLKFKVELINQGNVPIDSLDVTNYLPEGLVFINDIGMGGLNEGWDATDPMNPVFNWGGDTLTRDARDTICIYSTFEAIAVPTPDSWTSVAEISFAQDTSGIDVSLMDDDSDLNANPNDNGGSEVFTDADDYVDGDAKGAMNTTPDGVDSTDQDNVDPAAPEVCDLALIQLLDSIPPSGIITENDTVKFLIKVYNQGNAPAHNIQIIDSIPCGYNFPVDPNTEWSMLSSTEYLFSGMDTLQPGACDSTYIYLSIKTNAQRLMDCSVLDDRQFDNYAEIFDAKNPAGLSKNDLDSDPNSRTPEELAVIPNLPGDNDNMSTSNDSVGSQDDSDFANINMLDYALTNMIDSTFNPGPYTYGDTVKFLMKVVNQGNIPADSIAIVNYEMDGLVYDPMFGNGSETNMSLGWNDIGGGVYENAILGDTLNFREVDSICIYYTLRPSNMDMAFVNYAEIAGSRDTLGNTSTQDVDAVFNKDKTDDGGGAPNTPTDDQLLGFGILGPNIPLDTLPVNDEDDQDPALVEIVDFALSQQLVTMGPFEYGDTVKAVIEITNQGNVIAETMELTTYIPNGFVFVADSNGAIGWSLLNDSTAAIRLDLSLIEMNDDTTMCIYWQLQPSDDINGWTNYTEISSAVDPDGRVLDDLDGDSPLNDDRDDNPGGMVNSPADDHIDGDGSGMIGDGVDSTDQDNVDPIYVDLYDLAVINQIDTTFTDIPLLGYGDTVKLVKTICNQTNEPALDIVLTELIPDGYAFIVNAGLNPNWSDLGGGVLKYNEITLLPGQEDTVICLYVTLEQITGPTGPNPYVLYTEIMMAQDSTGGVFDDVDSQPNSMSPQELAVLPDNPGDDDKESISRDSIGSEDDIDPAGIVVYDLAIIQKIDTITTPPSYRYEDSVKLSIIVVNQGGEDVSNVLLTEYVPEGLSFLGSENPGWFMLNDSIWQYRIEDVIEAWSQDTICIYVHPINVSESDGTTPDDPFTSFVEISEIADSLGNVVDDIDSFNDDVNDDPGQGPETPDDDNIDGDAKNGGPGEDEDNQDGALINILDIGLKVTTDIVVVGPGDVVTFDIMVFNQGSKLVTDVKLIDYISESYDFIDNIAINPGWMASGTDAIYMSIDSLQPQSDTTIQINLLVNDNITEFGLIHFVEILSSAETLMGMLDADSDPGDNPGPYTGNPLTNPDPNGGDPFGPSDDQLDGEAIKNEDSDDHDGAFTIVCQTFACKESFNISLGHNCEFVFKADMFLKDFPIPEILVTYKVIDEYGNVEITNTIGEKYLGQCVNVKVIIPDCQNSCWTTVCVDNKYPPLLECKNDTIGCYDPLPTLPTAGPNCSQPYEVEVAFQKWHPFDCNENDNFEGFYSRTIRATDAWGQIRDCSDTIFIRRMDMDSILCPENVVIDCCVKGLVPGTTDSIALLWSDYFTDTDVNGIPHPKPIIDEHGNSIGLVDPPFAVENGDTSWLLSTNGHCQIVSNYHDHVFPGCGGTFKIKRTWEIQNWCAERDTVCIQWIKVVDTVPPVVDETSIEPIIGVVNASTCEAEVVISRPRIKEECSLKFYKGRKGVELIKVHYLIEVPSHDHLGGKEVFYGTLGVDENVQLKLPEGSYHIEWTVSDDCFQSEVVRQEIHISDETGPIAICDNSHVITLDANQCWGRIYAKDLDDGSFDNCCEEIHYAVAKMSDIETWTNKLRADIIACEGEDVYQANRKAFEDQISILIGCYVFDDYVDVTDCGEEMLVFRAYQACGLPIYDPHTFAGSKHEWYCVNAYTSFAVYWNLFNYKAIEDFNYCATVSLNIAGNMNYDLPALNPLYGECMSTLRKDDKQAPECVAPADFAVYNDGIPTSGSLEIDGAPVAYAMAATAADVMFSNPAVFPWDGSVHGYYSGPLVDGLGDPCIIDPMYAYVLPPVYCRFWLLLDRLDAFGAPEINFGEPVIRDVCTAPEGLDVQTVDAENLDDCGAGIMTRTWTISDRCGNTTTCYQTITILARSDFEVIFPRDTVIDCAIANDLSPEALGLPVITDNEVEQTGVSSSDVVEDLGGGCKKIKRTWKVIDWCLYDPNFDGQRAADIIVDDQYRASKDRACVIRNIKDEGDGLVEYVQIIKIVDTEAPEIICSATPDVFNSTLDTCGPLNISFLLGSSTDNCTPEDEMIYRYFYRDTAMTTVTWFGSGNTFEEKLENGVYDIFFVADDGCDNTDTCIIQIEVRDGKAPTAICKGDLTTLVMQPDGMIVVEANIFNAGASDNCTDAGDLIFSFTEDGLSPTDTFSCADIPDGISNTLLLDIYILDEAGNVGLCADVMLELQDGAGDLCLDVPQQLVNVSGQIMTENSEGVEDVLVDMQPYTSKRSDRKGSFDFEQITMNKAYDLVPYYNENPLNGVSTLDLVGIQKHILGIAPLESPYRIIAADINNSKSVTAIDIVELRKLILGIYDEFPDNTSWRFADAQYEFSDPVRPWNFKEMIKLNENRMHDPSQDFVGIKVGDVNGTVTPHSLFDASVRNTRPIYDWTIEDQTLVRDGLYEVEVLASRDVVLTGFQNTLDLGDLDYLGITGGSIEMTVDHIGLRYIEDGVLTMSWHTDHGRLVKAGEVLFTLNVKARSDGKLSELIDLNSKITKSELYDGKLAIHDVKLDFGTTDAHMLVDQNRPNPFIDRTMIRFTLPVAEEVEILIYNNQGILMKQHKAYYNRGKHEYEVKALDLGSSGVYHYEVKTTTESVMKKMILLR